MYNYSMNNSAYYPYSTQNNNNSDNRLVGGFAFPFLLGGVTGAAIAPAFWRPPYSPYYNNYRPYYYGPYPRYY